MYFYIEKKATKMVGCEIHACYETYVPCGGLSYDDQQAAKKLPVST